MQPPDTSGLAPRIWSLCLCCELCSACWVQRIQSLCCFSLCRQYSLSAESKTMAHPNNLDRCQTKYLMHNIVSCGVWWWLVGACAVPALVKLLEDQQKLKLRRKPGAKTHCITHRLLLQYLPTSTQGNTISSTRERDGVWPWLSPVLCRCCTLMPSFISTGAYVVEHMHIAAQ